MFEELKQTQSDPELPLRQPNFGQISVWTKQPHILNSEPHHVRPPTKKESNFFKDSNKPSNIVEYSKDSNNPSVIKPSKVGIITTMSDPLIEINSPSLYHKCHGTSTIV